MVLKNLLQAVMHKRKAPPDTSASIYRMLLPSCLTILLSTVCFMASTWAWFTANQSSGVMTIQAGSFSITNVAVDKTVTTKTTTTYTYASSSETDPKSGEPLAICTLEPPAPTSKTGSYEESVAVTAEGGAWRFNVSAYQRHHVTMTTEGSVKGVCEVHITWTSGEVEKSRTLYGYSNGDRTIEFNLLWNAPCTVTIIGRWGEANEVATRDQINDPTVVFTNQSTMSLLAAWDEEDAEGERVIRTFGDGEQKPIEYFNEVILTAPVPEVPPVTEGSETGKKDPTVDANEAENTVSTPENNGGTPENNGGTPENTVSTPENNGSTPENNGGTPENNGGMPENNSGTPENNVGTPENTVGTSENTSNAPENTASAPENNGSTETTDQ